MTLSRVIQVTLDKERYAADLTPAVIDNDAYVQFVLKVDFLQGRIKEWLSEMPEGQADLGILVERVFILLGKQASRNLIASIRLARLADTLPKKKSDRFGLNTKEQLKHSLACEEFCEVRNYAEAHFAFLAGLQYDFLLTAFTRSKAPREVMNAFPNHFAESLRIAHFAYEIGSRMGSFPYLEYAFAAGLSLGLGKLLAYPLYPKEGGTNSYSSFLSEIEKKTVLKWVFAEQEEKARFPLTPNELAALAVLNYGFFVSIEPAVRFSKEPYLLKKAKPRLHPLALLLRLAEASAAGRPIPESDLKDLRALRVNPGILASAAKAVNTVKGK